MEELKIVTAGVLLVLLIICSVATMLYLFNREDWAVELRQKEICLERGGVFIKSPELAVCYVLLPPLE